MITNYYDNWLMSIELDLLGSIIFASVLLSLFLILAYFQQSKIIMYTGLVFVFILLITSNLIYPLKLIQTALICCAIIFVGYRFANRYLNR